MNELRVDIGGSNRGFQIATEDTKRLARDMQRSMDMSSPETFKGAQMMREKYGKMFDGLKGHEGMGGLTEKIAGGFGEAGEAVMRLATGPIGIATAALAVMGETAKGAWETMKESFELSREARNLGVTTVGLQKVHQAADEQGMDPNEASGRLYRLTNKVGEAAAGDKGAKSFFKELGVEVEGRKMEEILNDVSKAFEEINDPAERAHKAVELFGRGGQEMVPVLLQLREHGNVLEAMGISDEHTDAVLGGAWKKIHGFFNNIKDATKTISKTILANMIEGHMGDSGEEVAAPEKVKAHESPESKASKAADAVKHTKDLIEAQRAYHAVLESTANAADRYLMLLQDETALQNSLELANAAKDEVEILKIKTDLLRKQKEIAESRKAVNKEHEDKHKPSEQIKAGVSSHVDSLSGAGLFTSAGAISNPMLVATEKQLAKLEAIHGEMTRIKSIFT